MSLCVCMPLRVHAAACTRSLPLPAACPLRGRAGVGQSGESPGPRDAADRAPGSLHCGLAPRPQQQGPFAHGPSPRPQDGQEQPVEVSIKAPGPSESGGVKKMGLNDPKERVRLNLTSPDGAPSSAHAVGTFRDRGRVGSPLPQCRTSPNKPLSLPGPPEPCKLCCAV